MAYFSKSIPSYRKHKQSGQAIVTLSGKDFLLGPHGTKASRTKYDRLVAEWLIQDRQTALPQESALTMVELVARYWSFAKRKYGKAGAPALWHFKSVAKFVVRFYGDLSITEFGPLQLKVVRQSMVDQSGWSRNYINGQVARLVRIMKWGVTEGLLPAAVHAALALVPGLRPGESEARETARIKPVADEVVDATLPHLPAVVADMVRLQRLTGMRPGEVAILRPVDIDRTGEVWQYHPAKHKTQHHGRERVILIGPRGQEILLRYLARDAEAYCFRPCDSEAKRRAAAHAARKTPLSCGNKPGSNLKRKPKHQPGDKYDAETFRRAIRRACDKAGVESWSPNQLRHAAATQIRKKFGLEAAQVILGHSQANVTQVYAERDLEKGVEVAKRIG